MAQAQASLLDLNGLLRSGSVKARDVIREAVQALKAEGARDGSVRQILEREAMSAARGVERELSRGRTRGILQGAPFGVSELLQVSGRPPFWNADVHPRQAEDAAAVSRLRGARAIPLALLSSPPPGAEEFWRSGADPCAAVVGRRLLPFAIGLDFNGNVLRSALRHGCWALRPTFGTVSGFGTAPASWTLAAVTAVAGTPEDCGHVLSAMSGGDSRCFHSPGRTFRFVPQYARLSHKLLAAEGAAVPELLTALGKMGAAVESAPRPKGFSRDILEIILAAEACEAMEDEMASAAEGREILEQARELTAFDYLRAMRLRREVQEWFNEALAGSDAVIFPAASLAEPEPETEADAGPQEWLATALIAGAPVVAFGGGRGLPAFCLTGRAGAENPLLKLAAVIRDAASPTEKS